MVYLHIPITLYCEMSNNLDVWTVTVLRKIFDVNQCDVLSFIDFENIISLGTMDTLWLQN